MLRRHYEVHFANRFALEVDDVKEDKIHSGTLVDRSTSERFRIVDFIPRFVEGHTYARGFGLQWNRFRATQLDSHSGFPITSDRFWQNTRWRPSELRGKSVLEAGSGAGRFTEVLLNAGANVVSFDLSNAVEANYLNNKGKGDLLLYQGSIYAIPFPDDYFDFVFCYGVIQHTPEPQRAYRCLFEKAKPGGKLSVDVYRKKVPRPAKYRWRKITTRMNPRLLLAMIRAYMPLWFPLHTFLARRGKVGGKVLQYFGLPCWNHLHLPLSFKQRRQWAVLDTLDALSAKYDLPMSLEEVQGMVASDLNDSLEVFYGSNGIVANVVRR